MRELTASGGRLGARTMAPAVNNANASPCTATRRAWLWAVVIIAERVTDYCAGRVHAFTEAATGSSAGSVTSMKSLGGC